MIDRPGRAALLLFGAVVLVLLLWVSSMSPELQEEPAPCAEATTSDALEACVTETQ